MHLHYFSTNGNNLPWMQILFCRPPSFRCLLPIFFLRIGNKNVRVVPHSSYNPSIQQRLLLLAHALRSKRAFARCKIIVLGAVLVLFDMLWIYIIQVKGAFHTNPDLLSKSPQCMKFEWVTNLVCCLKSMNFCGSFFFGNKEKSMRLNVLSDGS